MMSLQTRARESSEVSVEERHAVIATPPPRITAVPDDQIDAEQEMLVDEFRAIFGLAKGTTLPRYFATMLRHPSLMKQQILFAQTLYSGVLPARLRELAILRVAWVTQSPYEWAEHVSAGKNLAQLSESDIEQIIQGSHSEHWSGTDKWVLKAVEELLTDAMIGNETWAGLAETLDEPQLIELLVLIGTYVGIGFLQNSIRFDLPAGNSGLQAR